MHKNELKALMLLNGDTGNSLAEYLGITRGTFSAKLNETNGAEFTQGEITKIKNKYNLDAETLDRIFFDLEVSK